MERTYTESKLFENIAFPKEPLPLGVYEDCDFVSCDFTGFDLSDYRFSGCNLGMVKLIDTTLNGVRFTDCKLVENGG